MAKRQSRPPLMVAVWAELGAGQITEAIIDDRTAVTSGYFDDGSRHITINPMPDVVDTIIHEILHRLHPAWPESYIRNRTTYLWNRMTGAEMRAFYAEYQKRKRTRKRPLVVTE